MGLDFFGKPRSEIFKQVFVSNYLNPKNYVK